MILDLAPRITVTKDGREIGYRRFGEGPPAVLLHASPRSAGAVLPLGERLASRFTIFAFDTPGFGWSEPLRFARPDGADFGDALMEAFDAVGLKRAPVYGTHTGAAIATAAALRHPERISALVLDGYPMFTPAEQTEYADYYLTPIRPDWAGTHLAWLWSRVKDQFTVFPWHLMGNWARLPRPLLSPAAMQNVVVDFLASGDSYRPAYAAAFRYDGGPAVRALTVPTTVMARSDDLLFGHLDLLGELPRNVSIQKLGEDHAEWAAAVGDALARGESGETPAVPGPTLRFNASLPGQEIIRVPGGTMGISTCGRGDDRKLVLLPGIPGSARGEAGLIRAFGSTFGVVAVDLPGFGASMLSAARSAGDIAEAMLAAVREIGVTEFDIAAMGESGAVGCALAALVPASRLVLLDPIPDEARADLLREMADVTPRRDGSHLFTAWHQLRDRKLWRPWFDARPEQALDFGVDMAVEALQATLADWMRGGTAGAETLSAVLASSLAQSLLPLHSRATIIALPSHPWSDAISEFAGRNSLRVVRARDECLERAAAVAAVLAS